jgi:hypothetical protein
LVLRASHPERKGDHPRRRAGGSTGRSAGDAVHASYAFAGRCTAFVWQREGPYQMTLSGSKGDNESNGNATNLKATNCPEADRFIGRAYRKGWEL